ncbi:CvfD/Ygs/GSP13 family RNA-binding post-transcriptional regulator [Aerococcus urinae]|uniref:CvfD/Ygs/GSP13 family RNA-binding post-transcriptional regulator n=1 Tax=Aerococcus urinae TaxID=1376 RepID=UPI00227C9CB3|nr:CvfD/Ygs/GSP13 family RNA-binding post-transcriptional regulator [Aerococcus urinae]MCY3047177.1 CvfD/Ygs/GSP13 family RNA-binding post-transcriptional regulator [Aerococcus urinae]
MERQENYRIGDILNGTVTGIQSYGLFIKLDSHCHGLVHISEVDHGYVTNLEERFSIGDQVKVKIIDIDEYTKKISLSIQALKATNTPNFPARIKKPKRRHTPQIGFKTINKKMPEWIENSLADIRSGKIKDYRLEE